MAELWPPMTNSRRKGKDAEQEFINLHLRAFWPQACRNIDQFGDDKRDCLNVGGNHFQIKRVESLNIWKAITQAETEARDGDLPIVAFRRNGTPWFIAMHAATGVPLLRAREELWFP
jgi:hypothetical protein